VIKCQRHGPQPETFVCQHVAESLSTREIVGFFCNERVKRTGGEWIGEAASHLGAKLLCGACYDDARDLNLST